jgi:nitroreductase
MEFLFDADKAGLFLAAMERRYACKRFKRNWPLQDEVIRHILECGRLSPSSFGLEPWHFIVVASPEKIADLGDACFSQEPVYTCSFSVVILVRKEDQYRLDAEFIHSRAERFPGGYEAFADDYRSYHDFLENAGRTLHWARSQAYIACANMMTGAAAIGLDSCPIEGFDEARVMDVVEKKAQDWAVGIIIAFGSRDEEIRTKTREELRSLAERI